MPGLFILRPVLEVKRPSGPVLEVKWPSGPVLVANQPGPVLVACTDRTGPSSVYSQDRSEYRINPGPVLVQN